MTTQNKISTSSIIATGPGSIDDDDQKLPPTACELNGVRCKWVIAAPSGPEAPGVCKVCGAERAFRNSFEYSSWYGSKNAPGRKPGRKPGRPKKVV